MAQDVTRPGSFPKPRDVDKVVIASLPPLVARSIEWIEEDDAAYYRFRGDLPPEEDRSRALDVVRSHMQPCDVRTIVAELGRLSLTTKSRDIGDTASDLMMTIYTEICQDYPADVVVDGLRAWSREEKFWPAEAEIRVFFNRRVHRRRALVFLLTHPDYGQ